MNKGFVGVGDAGGVVHARAVSSVQPFKCRGAPLSRRLPDILGQYRVLRTFRARPLQIPSWAPSDTSLSAPPMPFSACLQVQPPCVADSVRCVTPLSSTA